MYDFRLNNNEEIKLISDNAIVYSSNDEKNVTCIITNQRLLFLDYPSGVHNSAEDLRISGKMNYIRKKEVIGEVNLKYIENITKESDYYRIEFKNKEYINLIDDDIIGYLKGDR